MKFCKPCEACIKNGHCRIQTHLGRCRHPWDLPAAAVDFGLIVSVIRAKKVAGVLEVDLECRDLQTPPPCNLSKLRRE